MVYLKENYKKILPYAGIFFVLFMGSGLVKIPVGSVWFYIIKFGIIAAVLGIGVSAWWKSRKNNEPPTDYLKLALFVPFTIDFHLHYAFIFLTIILFNKKLLLPWNSPLKPIYLLFIWGFISYVVNQFVEFNPLSFPLFIFTFFLSFLFFALFFQFLTKQINAILFHFYFKLLFIVIFLILMKRLLWGDVYPDFLTGGQFDAHMTAILLAIGALISNAIIFKKFKEKKAIHLHLITIIIFLGIIFLLDAKYIFVFTLAIIVLSLPLVYIKKRIVSTSVVISLIFGVIILISLGSIKLPLSALALKEGYLSVNTITGSYKGSPKQKLVNLAINYPIQHPLHFLVGVGPGTFLSRVGRLLGQNGADTTTINDLKGEHLRGIGQVLPKKNSWYRIKHQELTKRVLLFSSILNNESSLLNILFEFGIVGIMLFLVFIGQFIYLKLNDNLMVMTLVAFYLLMSFFGLWLEINGFTMLLLSLIALGYVPEQKKN